MRCSFFFVLLFYNNGRCKHRCFKLWPTIRFNNFFSLGWFSGSGFYFSRWTTSGGLSAWQHRSRGEEARPTYGWPEKRMAGSWPGTVRPLGPRLSSMFWKLSALGDARHFPHALSEACACLYVRSMTLYPFGVD